VRRPAHALVVPGQGGLRADGAYRLTGLSHGLLDHAAALAAELRPAVVVFTGWSPSGGESEAAQLLAAWPGPADAELLAEETAATTAQNAARTVPLLRERGIVEATVVCARAHRLRVSYLFRGIYGRFGIECGFSSPPGGLSPGALAWEAGAFVLARRQRRAALAELLES
jgi:uncharacterized SAM-binding protein YcdF (DUF218 family)